MNNSRPLALETRSLETSDQWSRFMSGFVAELRTPLSSLMTLSELLDEAEALSGGPQDRRFASNLRQLAGKLQILVNDAGALIRLMRERPPSIPEIVVVREVLDRVENAARRAAWEHGVSITTIAEPGLPATVLTDPERLQDGLTHLLETAASVAERQVVFRAAACSGELVFRVEPDGGCGPVRPLEALLDPFEGGSARALRARGGRSLALLLARELSRALGGELVFDEGEEDSACEFRIPLVLDISRAGVV